MFCEYYNVSIVFNYNHQIVKQIYLMTIVNTIEPLQYSQNKKNNSYTKSFIIFINNIKKLYIQGKLNKYECDTHTHNVT